MFNGTTSSSTGGFSFGVGANDSTKNSLFSSANGSSANGSSAHSSSGFSFGRAQQQPGSTGNQQSSLFRTNNTDSGISSGSFNSGRFGSSGGESLFANNTGNNSFNTSVSSQGPSQLIATIDQPVLPSLPGSSPSNIDGSKLSSLSASIIKKKSASPLKHSMSMRFSAAGRDQSSFQTLDNSDSLPHKQAISHSSSMNFKSFSHNNPSGVTANHSKLEPSASRINRLVIKQQPSADSPFRNFANGRHLSSGKSTPVLERPPELPKLQSLKKAEPKRSAIENGYWILPNFAKLSKYGPEQLKAVPNLMVGRRGYGQISFNRPVDLSNLTNLGDILGNLVVFDDRMVCVYPDESEKAPEGTELNVPAVVLLEGCAPKEKSTGNVIVDASNPVMSLHVARLRQNVEQRGGEFITYDISNGVWVFNVPHFSTWTADVDYDADLIDMDGTQIDDTFAHKDKPTKFGTIMEDFGASIDDFEAIMPQNRFEAPPVEYDYDEAQEDDPIEDNIYDGAHEEVDFLNGNQLNEQEFSDGSNIEDLDMESDIDNLEPPELGPPSNSYGTGSPSPYVPGELKFDLPVDGWSEQLLKSSNQKSLVFDGEKSIAVRKINAGMLNRQIFDGVDILEQTDTYSYLNAAKELRLPEISKPYPIGTFNQGTDDVILRNQSKISNMEVTNVPYENDRPSFVITLREQINMSTIDCSRSANGLPLATPTEEVTFAFLASEFLKDCTIDESKLWELASILFDEIQHIGLTESLAGLAESAQSKVIERHRRRLLSAWLQDYVSPAVDRDLAAAKDDMEKVFILLSGHRIAQAAKVAVDSGNAHLATIIPLLGSDDEAVRSNAKRQINYWIEHRMVEYIPDGVIKVYELASGNVTTSRVRNLNIGENLDWKRAFGLRLWYETRNSISSIADAVKLYQRAYSEVTSKTVRPDASGREDMAFTILSFYQSKTADIRAVLDFNVGQWGLDFRLPWYIYLILAKSAKSEEMVKIGDSISVDYGMQLLSQGYWLESIFVLSHIKDNDTALKYISYAISRNVETIHTSEGGEEKLNTLLLILRVPKTIIFELDALRLRWQGNHLEETASLINADMWEEAHKTIVERVAPRAVIEDDVEPIVELLTGFRNEAISNWKVGGGLYLSYAKLVRTVNEIGTNDPLQDEKNSIASILNGLVQSLSEVSIDGNSNAEVPVAVAIMSSYVFSKALQFTNISGSRLLQMKMSKNDYLKHTLELSVQYFSSRV